MSYKSTILVDIFFIPTKKEHKTARTQKTTKKEKNPAKTVDIISIICKLLNK